MKKLLYILLSFISIQATAQIEQPRIKFNQVIKDSTGSGRIVISSLTDSNMIYSTDFYINPTDSLLIFFGDTIVGGGSLSSVLVDSVYIFGDGSTTPLTFSTEKLQDTLNTFLQAGLGISIDYNDADGELTISSLTIQDSVYNGTGSTIYIGTPLYADSAQGNYWSVAPASNTDINKLPVVAIAGDSIPSGQVGLALIKGHVKGVNTSMFSPGDEIWVGADGTYTNIKPKGGDVYLQSLGTVVKSNENGTGIINIQDVQLTLAPNEIFIGGVDSLITSVDLPTVISDSLSNYASKTELADSTSNIRTDIPTIITDSLNNYLPISDYIVDSTRLTQDSILVYYQNGTIIRQDTISGIGSSAGGGLNVYQQTFTVTTDSSFTLSNAPLSKEYVIVAENGLVIDNDLFSVTGTSLDLTYMPQEGQLTAIWFEGSGGSGGGLSSVSVDSLTIYGDGLTTPLYVDTTFMTTKRYVDSVATTLGGGAMFQQIFIADGSTNQFTVTENSGNLPATDKDLLVAENGQILDKDLITLDQGNNLVILDSIPEAGSRIAVIWFDAIAINGGLDSVFTDNTITGNGLTGSPLRVDTSIIATTTALNDSLAGFQSFANITEGNDTVYISNHLNVDTATLFVQANSNRVGIRTTNPNAIFDIQAPNTNSAGDQWFGINQDGTNGSFSILSGSTGTGIFAPAFSLVGTGINGYSSSFIIGIQDANDVLASIGAVAIFDVYSTVSPYYVDNANLFMFRNYDSPVMTIEADGEVRFDEYGAIIDLRLDGDGRLYNGGSDERLKNSINDINFGLNEVMLLKPKEFWRNNEKQNYDLKEVGFIAQDVRSVIPNAVVNSKNGYFQLRTDAILATSIKAIQEQQSIIESQATKIQNLESTIQTQQQQIQDLINRITAIENQ